MATATQWIAGARPRTLPAATAPVLVGSGAAALASGFHLGRALLALGVAVALQVGVNYANDYSDGVRGTDTDRVGPLRLTASLLAPATAVRGAAFTAFGVAALLGLGLVILSGTWWLLIVGALSILAAWYYTGGKHPYGYAGLGELGVFVFFGLVATLGTTVTQLGGITWPATLGSVAVGLVACAILMINNLRDLPNDVVAGKRTLAVRVGAPRARLMYIAMLWLPLALAVLCVLWSPWVLLVLVLLLPVTLLSVPVMLGAQGHALVPVLGGTGFYELALGALLGLGLALGS